MECGNRSRHTVTNGSTPGSMVLHHGARGNPRYTMGNSLALKGVYSMRKMCFLIRLLVPFLLFGCANNATPPSAPASPFIGEANPSCGVPGETVIITGTGFGDTQNSSQVTFNGVLAVVTSWSNTQISVLVPPTITGDVIVTVNGVNSNGVRFTIPCYVGMQQL